ncbi:hypothetical protein M409DRAFT_28525 [Zasmidium cellare ATCC 36951]|uniref:Uncharacterized protein n=1 Tax=Zasmidium cellare ATCC 36951 TaxID=1080233 RepID=A0A6A6C751_ZASCE|nr:uncharacterized protein M409DRAFT_28525 [Zasmidium cellare ATCC 36951]KAF2161196.1 hypothetical protein M409DRAFT_28525 [Zasmidium cellare ATCC 36951]
MQPLSWAKVAAGATVDPTTGMEYSIKPARRRQKLQPVANKCNGRHCNADLLRCPLPQCIQSVQAQLSKIQADNVVLAASCDKLLQDIKDLREDIFRECKTDDFKDDDMEASRIALGKTLRPRAQEVECLCVVCELKAESQHQTLLRQRFEAAQKRHTALKQYRRANDKETLKRISSSVTTGKYFTPVGSLHAGGVTALRPTLQMQTSYNFAALTTNSMSARPLKMGWKDKPKPGVKQ